MTAQNHPDDRLHYLPSIVNGQVRVTLTAPLTDSCFLGEYEGDPVRVIVIGADVIRVRHAIRDHGSVTWDAPASYVDAAKPEDLRAADPEHIPLSEEERVALATLRLLQRGGVIRPGGEAAADA
jgi:hypothetical protein